MVDLLSNQCCCISCWIWNYISLFLFIDMHREASNMGCGVLVGLGSVGSVTPEWALSARSEFNWSFIVGSDGLWSTCFILSYLMGVGVSYRPQRYWYIYFYFLPDVWYLQWNQIILYSRRVGLILGNAPYQGFFYIQAQTRDLSIEGEATPSVSCTISFGGYLLLISMAQKIHLVCENLKLGKSKSNVHQISLKCFSIILIDTKL